MEMSAKFVVEVLLLLIILALVLYAIIDKGILTGSNSIFSIGQCWIDKLFSPAATSACS
jgi:hypothetical protein